MMADGSQRRVESAGLCRCFTSPGKSLVSEKALGMDDVYAEVSVLGCPLCGQHWLRYFFEIEAFTASGRWYLGAIPADQVPLLSAENAKATLEKLSWYFYGGSYYEGESGRTSGSIQI